MVDFITVVAPGVNISTSGVSSSVALPVAQSGEVPRYVRVAGTAAGYVRLGTSGVTAAAGDTLVQPADAVVLHVPRGVTHIAAIQDTGAGKINVVPLENL